MPRRRRRKKKDGVLAVGGTGWEWFQADMTAAHARLKEEAWQTYAKNGEMSRENAVKAVAYIDDEFVKVWREALVEAMLAQSSAGEAITRAVWNGDEANRAFADAARVSVEGSSGSFTDPFSSVAGGEGTTSATRSSAGSTAGSSASSSSS